MNKLPVYHIIIRILICPIFRITVPISYEKQDGCRHCSIHKEERDSRTAVEIDTIDQLSTYIQMYVDNDQNNVYDI